MSQAKKRIKEKNFVELRGRIGTEIQRHRTKQGVPCISFRLATHTYYKNNGDEKWKKKTEWHRIEYYGKDAYDIADVLSVKDLIEIEGKIIYKKIDGPNGPYSITVIKADHIQKRLGYE